MSWSVLKEKVEAGAAADDIRDVFDAEHPKANERQQDQFDAGVKALDRLVDAVAPDGGLVTVSIGGHLADEPGPGDNVTVSVTRVAE